MDKKHTTTEVDKHIAKEVDKHTAKEEDKNTAKEADKQTAKEEDKYTAKEADKHTAKEADKHTAKEEDKYTAKEEDNYTAKEADKHTAKEMDCAHSGDKDEANIVAEEEEEEWLNCEKCFSTFPKEQKESHNCLPVTSPSRTSSTQSSDVIDIEDETSTSSDVIKSKPAKKSATGEKYKCTHCNGWASTTRLLKNHIQAKHGFIAREDRMECEPEGNQNVSDVQVQVCNSTKLTNARPVRCKNSNESIAAPSDSSLNDLLHRKEISKKTDQPLVRLEKLPKIPTRTNITLLPKKAPHESKPEEKRPSKDSLLNVADGCCPLCGQAFTNLTKLENHAGRCRGRPK